MHSRKSIQSIRKTRPDLVICPAHEAGFFITFGFGYCKPAFFTGATNGFNRPPPHTNALRRCLIHYCSTNHRRSYAMPGINMDHSHNMRYGSHSLQSSYLQQSQYAHGTPTQGKKSGSKTLSFRTLTESQKPKKKTVNGSEKNSNGGCLTTEAAQTAKEEILKLLK